MNKIEPINCEACIPISCGRTLEIPNHFKIKNQILPKKVTPQGYSDYLRNCCHKFFHPGLNSICSYIFRERNCCADKLANHSHTIAGTIWFNTIPHFLLEDFSSFSVSTIFSTVLTPLYVYFFFFNNILSRR